MRRERLIDLYKRIFVGSAAGSSNGRTTGFGPVNLGSSPSPAALNANMYG